MAKILKQTVVQIEQEGIEKRIVVQYKDDNGDDKRSVINYVDLTEEEKTIFDSFESLSQSKMI